MLMTERKAITLILEQLMDEERDLKNYYRAEKSRIENQKNDLLNRLERLDNLEREAVDSEGILQSMAQTADKLAELLPPVPAADMIERAAQIVAKEAIESGAEIKGSAQIEAEKEAEKTKMVIEEAKAIKPLQQKEKKDIELPGGQYLKEKIVEVLKESRTKTMSAKEIKKALHKKYGYKTDKFNASFAYVKKNWPDLLDKRGMFYTLRMTEKDKVAREKEAERNREWAAKIVQDFKTQGAIHDQQRAGTTIQTDKETKTIF